MLFTASKGHTAYSIGRIYHWGSEGTPTDILQQKSIEKYGTPTYDGRTDREWASDAKNKLSQSLFKNCIFQISKQRPDWVPKAKTTNRLGTAFEFNGPGGFNSGCGIDLQILLSGGEGLGFTPSGQDYAAMGKTRAMNVLLVDHQMALEDEIYVAAKMKEAKDKTDQELRDKARKASPFGK